jgi:hypothetical protein
MAAKKIATTPAALDRAIKQAYSGLALAMEGNCKKARKQVANSLRVVRAIGHSRTSHGYFGVGRDGIKAISKRVKHYCPRSR